LIAKPGETGICADALAAVARVIAIVPKNRQVLLDTVFSL